MPLTQESPDNALWPMPHATAEVNDDNDELIDTMMKIRKIKYEIQGMRLKGKIR